ncbi:3'-5' exonuclease [Aquamicrobium sp.]|uniref:3'-5' exonuclease n=1 Tax=Aquamicrobium sp. TaxID=1872579 RepID=UPI00258E8B19|nr:3'-5' exonuclease [Aquamicrobium sp.]MCK9549472.1 UvrD-helicase domain-containing protein [Aquamicrobium sp.]
MTEEQTEEQSVIVNGKFGKILVVNAYAGTGKSYTLKQYCLSRPNKRIIYFVYGSSNKIDALKSFAGLKNVVIVTFHGLAYKLLGIKYKNRLEHDLTPIDFKKYLINTIDESRVLIASSLLFNMIVEFCQSDMDIDNFLIYLNKNRVNYGLKYKIQVIDIIRMFPSVWNDLISSDDMPISHDIYLKLFQLSCPTLDYDDILIDEAQDLNACMLSIVYNQNSKRVYVGDMFQSIFTWRGAVNSIQQLSLLEEAKVVYLSKSFRCSPYIAEIANNVIRKAGAEKDFIGIGGTKPIEIHTPAIIARTNGKLINFCVDAILDENAKIYFVGGVKNYNLKELLDIKYLMSKRHDFIKNKFYKQFENIKELKAYADEIEDIGLKSLIGIVLKHSKEDAKIGLHELIKLIKESATASIKEADYIVTTAHKSKGLEWDNVVLLDDFIECSKVSYPDQKEKEELYLLYVAITRAKHNIEFRDGGMAEWVKMQLRP